MVQGTQATDTFSKYCQMDGESSNRNIPIPTILIQVRCFTTLRAFFSLLDATYLLVVFPNPCKACASGVGGE